MRKINIKPDRKITEVTEAYSVQPQSYYVGDTYFGADKEAEIALITFEQVEPYFQAVETVNYYVGWDKNNNELFRLKADAVNVFFEPE